MTIKQIKTNSSEVHEIKALGLPFGVCDTAADTDAKTATVDVPFDTLETGITVIIKFTYSNTASSPTLNVNETGAKSIKRYGTAAVSTGTTTTGWTAGTVQMFTYDGTNWVRDYWNNTTYSTFTKSGSSAASGLVPKPPTTAATTKFLREDATWAAPPNTNTKNTAGSTDSSSKLFLIGAESQATNPQTYSHDTVYVDTDGCLYSNSTKVSVEGHNHDDKMDKTNPTGTGSLSLNRKASTTVGSHSVAEGYNTEASGKYSHAEGAETIASAQAAHAEGTNTTASNNHSHAEGIYTTASGFASHAEGGNISGGGSQDAFTVTGAGMNNTDIIVHGSVAYGSASHAEGGQTLAAGACSHAEGCRTQALEDYSHAEGRSTIASGESSHAEGHSTVASGSYSHAEGYNTTASGDFSHAEGRFTIASGTHSHAEGGKDFTFAQLGSRVFPYYNVTARTDEEIKNGVTLGGNGTVYEVQGASIAAGNSSHAQGVGTTALAETSFTSGLGTVSVGNYETVIGKWNSYSDGINQYWDRWAFIIGNGTDDDARSNAFAVEWDGTIYVGDKKLIDIIYPVGSLYISTQDISPASLFGGEWTQVKGAFPYLTTTGFTGTTAGSNTHTLTTAQMPSHSHTVNIKLTANKVASGSVISRINDGGTATANCATCGTAGSGSSHNNMPLYMVFYGWYRTK